MKKDIFAICDPEAAYALRLTEFIQERQGTAFEIHAFTNVKSLCEFAAGHEVSLLLISTRAMCREVRELPIEKIVILSEGEILEELSEYSCIYKYQASDSLVAEVMEDYAAERRTPQALLKKDMCCIAIYSPIKRVLKTSFALTLGQLLAKDRKVLYLNMESCSGFSRLMEKEFTADISDLMYFIKRDGGSLVYKLQGIVQSLGNLDYVPPALSPMDIRSVECKEWLSRLEEVESYSTYEMIILDFDESVDGFLEILRRCQMVYMPVREDNISVAKIRQYEKLLEFAGYGDLEEKTRKLKLPFHGNFGQGTQYVEQLIWGELGDFARNLIREEFGNG